MTRAPAARTHAALAATLAGALALAGCPDRDASPEVGQEPGTRFEAALTGLGDFPITGTASLELGDDVVRATVQATGLPPGGSVSQHVYAWWDCTTIGRILVNLDAGLTIPGEGPPRGDDYPAADEAGRLEYTAERPRDELEHALHEYRGMLFEELDLENRTIFLRDEGHRPIACGALRSVD